MDNRQPSQAMSIFDKLRGGVLSGSADETQALARELALALPPEATIALHGDLGVGKTTFVQGMAAAFGIVEPVTSPTFTLYSLYRGTRLLVHLDAYRLSNAAQMDALLVEDFLSPPYCLAIEWPERIAEWIPTDAMHLDLGIEDGGHRLSLRH